MLTMREAWGRTLVEIGGEDLRTVVVDADLATSTRADLFATAYPDRFFQMGIAEQQMVGAAVGLAMTGLVPWISTFGVFLSHRSLDPIRMLVAQCRANVKIVASYTGVCFGMAGKTHHDHADISIIRSLPGMVLLAPGDNAECVAMTRWAQGYDGPVYLRLIRDAPEPLPGEPVTSFQSGEIRVLRPGGDVTLISTASQTARVIAAADLLVEEGIDAGVVHVPCLKPLDIDALRTACSGTPLVVTVEDQSVYGGLGGMVAEVLADMPQPVRVSRIGLQDCWVGTGSNDYVLDTYGLSPLKISKEVNRLLNSFFV